MEDILVYLIPIILILAFLFPKGKKKQVQESVQPTSQKAQANTSSFNIFGKLNKMLEEYYQSDMDAAPERSKRQDPFAMGDEPYQVEDRYEDEDDEEEEYDPEKKQMEEAPSAAAMKVNKTEPAMKPDSEKTMAVDMGEPVPAASSLPEGEFPYSVAKAGKRDLRKAIIWSEILAPPVALRDK